MGALAHRVAVDIACGSLHCLACTSDGKVFAWGDNDEGQIGNDSTAACQSPHVSNSTNLHTSMLGCVGSVAIFEIVPLAEQDHVVT